METYSQSDNQYANKTYAALTRAQWEDVESRFHPREEELFGMVGNTANVESQIQNSDEFADQALTSAQRSQDMGLAMYGVTADTQTQKANDRGLSLAHAAAKAGGQNTVRRANYDRDMDILAGSSAGLREATGV